MLLALSLLLSGAHAADEVSGFVEVRGLGFLGVDGVPYQAIARVRPTWEGEISERVKLVGTIEAQLSGGRDTETEFQNYFETTAFFDPELNVPIAGYPRDTSLWDYAQYDWPEDQYENQGLKLNGASDMFSVERLFVDFYHEKFDLRVGRQAVQWGSAQLINPTDPFPQVLFTEPWKFRDGVNAARLTVPISQHQVQLFVGANDTFTAERVAARGTLNVGSLDISAVGAHRGETNAQLAGLDLRGTLGVGYWFEGAYHFPVSGNAEKGVAAADPYEELAVGIDYSFPVLEMLVLSAQYYRNGSGGSGDASAQAARLAGAVRPPVSSCTDCLDINIEERIGLGDVGNATVDPYAPFTTGTNYGLFVGRADYTQEVSSQFAFLQNLDDGTAVLIPQVTVFPVGWGEISLMAQVPMKTWGDGGEFKPSEADLQREVEIDQTIDLILLDFNGLVADATVSAWVRASF